MFKLYIALVGTLLFFNSSAQPRAYSTYHVPNICIQTKWPLLSLLLDSTFTKLNTPGQHTVYCQADTIKAVIEFDSKGQRTGSWAFYYPNGKPMCSLTFAGDNRLTDYKDYYTNGHLRIEIPHGTLAACEDETEQYLINPVERTSVYTLKCTPYYNINGPRRTYGKHGEYSYLNTVSNGIDNGLFAAYDSTGKKIMECQCKYGEVAGEPVYFK